MPLPERASLLTLQDVFSNDGLDVDHDLVPVALGGHVVFDIAVIGILEALDGGGLAGGLIEAIGLLLQEWPLSVQPGTP